MASKTTLAKRAERNARRAAAREAQESRERGQVAAQFITELARDLYKQNVALLSEETPEALYAAYERVAHKCMDAAIAFIRASNSYDDRGRVSKDAPPILAPTDANGTPVTE